MSVAAEGVSAPAEVSRLNVRQAAFIGVGSMVGAGIFALLGTAGEVAGAAVWVSFLIAGTVAILQGYSFAKLGARYPSTGVVLVTFVFTTLIHKPASIVMLLVILLLSIGLDYWWKRSRTGKARPAQVLPNPLEQA